VFERYERQVDIVAICPTLSVSLVLSENLSTFKVGRLAWAAPTTDPIAVWLRGRPRVLRDEWLYGCAKRPTLTLGNRSGALCLALRL
jgi:hypothetical protein